MKLDGDLTDDVDAHRVGVEDGVVVRELDVPAGRADCPVPGVPSVFRGERQAVAGDHGHELELVAVRVKDGRGDGHADQVGKAARFRRIDNSRPEGRAALKGDGVAAHRVLPLPKLEGVGGVGQGGVAGGTASIV